MTNLNDLLSDVEIIQQTGDTDIEINTIQYDSRNVSPGDLFVAIKGDNFDGHDFIDAAIRRRARAVVTELPPSPEVRVQAGGSIPCIQVGNTRKALAHLASAYYDHSWRSMTLIGITGTNGKTSTAYLIESILKASGLRTGLLGTVAYHVGSDVINAEWTTPESSRLHQILHSMFGEKTDAVVMEVSSHALEQYRVEGLVFRVVVFTNISQDHLDYHRSMTEYAAAKQRLFEMVDPVLGENIINGDDPMSKEMVSRNHRPVISFSAEPGKADVFPGDLQYSFKGISATLNTPNGKLNVNSTLLGQHNLQNIMAAVCVGLRLDIPVSSIETGISKLTFIPGRLEPVKSGQPYTVLVDFAHTPDAIEKVIRSVRELIAGKLIVVFGCGGDRDKLKRPLMGSIAEKGADRLIITSDNPRNEDPMQIIQDTLVGVKDKKKAEIFVDRTEAIHRALSVAGESDCVLILGKGHESYQQIGSNKIPFDDRDVAHNYLMSKYNGTSPDESFLGDTKSKSTNEPIDHK